MNSTDLKLNIYLFGKGALVCAPEGDNFIECDGSLTVALQGLSDKGKSRVRVVLGGRMYTADEDGTLTLPLDGIPVGKSVAHVTVAEEGRRPYVGQIPVFRKEGLVSVAPIEADPTLIKTLLDEIAALRRQRAELCKRVSSIESALCSFDWI